MRLFDTEDMVDVIRMLFLPIMLCLLSVAVVHQLPDEEYVDMLRFLLGIVFSLCAFMVIGLISLFVYAVLDDFINKEKIAEK